MKPDKIQLPCLSRAAKLPAVSYDSRCQTRALPWMNDRGSVLAVALIFGMVMAMAVASFLKLANHEAKLATRMFYANSSLNLAEAGVEKALFALNHNDWSGWNRTGNEALMIDEVIDLGRSVQGVIQARVLSINNNPIVQAGGVTQIPGAPDLVRQIEVRLNKRSLFANGITTRRGVRFNGNVDVDSYKSSLGPPSGSNRRDNGSVASTSVEMNPIILTGNSEIWGRVATGGQWPKLTPNAKIRGEDTPYGVNVDPNRVALDFAADFPEVDPPTTFNKYIPSINVKGNDKSATLGTPNVLEVIKMDSISVKANGRLTIVGPVIIHLTGNLELGGNGQIVIPKTGNAGAIIYIDGDWYNGGNGVANETNLPANLVVFGTNRVYQSIDLGGNAQWNAAVYAPNADLHIGGNVEMAGAVVADQLHAGGNFNFHYDEDLADQFGSDSYRMDRWREIFNVADRFTF